MIRPNEKLVNCSSNIKDDLEKIRKELIESFFQSALTHTDIVIKRKVVRFKLFILFLLS